MLVTSKPWTGRTHRAHSLKSQQKETFSLPVAMHERFLSHHPYCLTQLESWAGVDSGISDDHTTGGGIWHTRAGCRRSMSNERSAMQSQERLHIFLFSKAREERTSQERGLFPGPLFFRWQLEKPGLQVLALASPSFADNPRLEDMLLFLWDVNQFVPSASLVTLRSQASTWEAGPSNAEEPSPLGHRQTARPSCSTSGLFHVWDNKCLIFYGIVDQVFCC